MLVNERGWVAFKVLYFFILSCALFIDNSFDTTDQSTVLKIMFWASLVVQWLRIRLPMQGARVRALVWEDPTCNRATKPVHHNY